MQGVLMFYLLKDEYKIYKNSVLDWPGWLPRDSKGAQLKIIVLRDARKLYHKNNFQPKCGGNNFRGRTIEK